MLLMPIKADFRTGLEVKHNSRANLSHVLKLQSLSCLAFFFLTQGSLIFQVEPLQGKASGKKLHRSMKHFIK